MKKIFAITLFVAVYVIFYQTNLYSQTSHAQKTQAQSPSKNKSTDVILFAIGDPKAKHIITEYTSLSCHHCAEFHLDTVPELKKKYIKNKKVRLVVKPYVSDAYALNATKVVLSLPLPQREEAVTRLYRLQSLWLGNGILDLAKSSGQKEKTVKKMLNNKKLDEKILADSFQTKKLGVDATPSFQMGSIKLEGAMTLVEFEKNFGLK